MMYIMIGDNVYSTIVILTEIENYHVYISLNIVCQSLNDL